MTSSPQQKVHDFFRPFPVRRYAKGAIILTPGDTPSGCYFLKHGHVREYGTSLDGIEVTIHIFNPEAYFPMLWIVSNIPNRYYYEALDAVEVQIAPKKETVAFLQREPDVLYHLFDRLLHGLDRVTARLEYLTHSNATSRVLSILLYLARHFGVQQQEQITISGRFTHRDIASLTGLTRETVSRVWKKLAQQQLVSLQQHSIIIPDRRAIEKLLSETA